MGKKKGEKGRDFYTTIIRGFHSLVVIPKNALVYKTQRAFYIEYSRLCEEEGTHQ